MLSNLFLIFNPIFTSVYVIISITVYLFFKTTNIEDIEKQYQQSQLFCKLIFNDNVPKPDLIYKTYNFLFLKFYRINVTFYGYHCSGVFFEIDKIVRSKFYTKKDIPLLLTSPYLLERELGKLAYQKEAL